MPQMGKSTGGSVPFGITFPDCATQSVLPVVFFRAEHHGSLFRDHGLPIHRTSWVITMNAENSAVEQTLSEKRAQSNRRPGARAAVGNVKPYSTCPDCLDNN